MTMSVEMKMIHAKAAAYDETLRANDPRFARCVRVVLDDGCSFFIDPAFVVKKGVWYMVFSEHHAFSVFHVDDVVQIAMYGSRIPIVQVKL